MLVRVRLRHLHVFLKTAELGSVQRAAAAVGMSQPSASQVLADLEELLGCILFHRHARGATLSRPGAALLPFARRMLDLVHEAADVVAALGQSAHGVVRIASISSGVLGILADAMPEFSRRHPDLLVQIEELDIERIGMALSREEVDLVLCREPAVLPAGWSFRVLQPDCFVVVAGLHHPLAGKPAVPLARLWEETWLQGPTASAARRMFDRLAADHGVAPRMRLVSTRSPAIFWSMLEREPIVSLMPLSFARQLLGAGLLCRLNVGVELPFDALGVMYRQQDEGAAAAIAREFLEAWPGTRADHELASTSAA